MTGTAVPQRLRRQGLGAAPVVMVVAAALGLVFTLAALRGEAGGTAVAVAAHDLEAGSILRTRDLRYEQVRAGERVLTRLTTRAAARRVVGFVVTSPLTAGEPLLAGHVRPRAAADGRRAMSIPVERSRAVNGRLQPGDRVDVVVADGGSAVVVAAALEVLDVDEGDGGAFGARRGEVSVTLAVDVLESQLLTAALANGDFVLTRVTGAVPAAPSAVRGATPASEDGR